MIDDVSATRAAAVARLRRDMRSHLRALGISEFATNGHSPEEAKSLIRTAHSFQRHDVLQRELPTLSKHAERLLDRFATGDEIDPVRIKPRLIEVQSDTDDAMLFRLATTLWSVPVSRGYGRRMRFLVVDEHNDKLIGVFALADPVFNLKVRDEWIGWTVAERRQRLVNVMDAFVVGAVPPYTHLLGGKLVTALIGSKEVARRFQQKYRENEGAISGQVKRPRLALVTVTSALGRSSIYNRVRLPGLHLLYIGETRGFGHFQVPEDTFRQMRTLLSYDDHKYANGHQYGDGPNWRIRVIREALHRVGLKGDILQHGIAREVYAMPLADNWREFLSGRHSRLRASRQTTAEIAASAIERWVLPRAERRPEFRDWTSDDTRALLTPFVAAPVSANGHRPDASIEPLRIRPRLKGANLTKAVPAKKTLAKKNTTAKKTAAKKTEKKDGAARKRRTPVPPIKAAAMRTRGKAKRSPAPAPPRARNRPQAGRQRRP